MVLIVFFLTLIFECYYMDCLYFLFLMCLIAIGCKGTKTSKTSKLFQRAKMRAFSNTLITKQVSLIAI